MELVVNPNHPAAVDVGSSPRTHVGPDRVRQTDVGGVASPEAVVGAYYHYNDDDPAGCTYHHDYEPSCARCLIAAGLADDVTARLYDPASGRLREWGNGPTP